MNCIFQLISIIILYLSQVGVYENLGYNALSITVSWLRHKFEMVEVCVVLYARNIFITLVTKLLVAFSSSIQ